MDEILEEEFNRELEGKVKEMVKKKIHTPSILIKMAGEYGYCKASKRLILKPDTLGYLKLFEEERLDLSIEDSVVKPKFKSLFTDEEIDACKKRLKLN